VGQQAASLWLLADGAAMTDDDVLRYVADAVDALEEPEG
jgi:hypothetical protein